MTAAPTDPNAPARGSFVVPEIVEEHFDELVFLSIARRKLLFGHDATDRQLAHHLARMEAHWDGLVVAGRFGAELAAARVAESEGWDGAVAVTAWITLASPEPQEVDRRLVECEEEQRPAWCEGLRACARERIAGVLPVDADADREPGVLAVCADAWGWHGLLDTRSAATLCAHPAPAVRAAVARQLAWVDGGAGLAAELLDDADPGVARRALFALAATDAPRVLDRCRVASDTAPDSFTIQMLGLLGDSEDVARLGGLLDRPAWRGAVAVALSCLGDPSAVPYLIRALDDPDPAVADLARVSIDRIVGELPEVEPAEDETPAGGAARAWSEIGHRYPGGVRLLRGVPFTPSALGDAPTGEARWLATWAALRTGDGAPPREVPDGFWNGLPGEEAVPGE